MNSTAAQSHKYSDFESLKPLEEFSANHFKEIIFSYLKVFFFINQMFFYLTYL